MKKHILSLSTLAFCLAILPLHADRHEGHLTTEGSTTVERWGNEKPCDHYTLEITEGKWVTIAAESDDFDAAILVKGEDDFEIENDDFNGRNPQVGFLASYTGTIDYYIFAIWDDDEGDYTIETEMHDIEEIGVVEGSLSEEDALDYDDGSYYDIHTVDVEADVTYIFEMHASRYATHISALLPEGVLLQGENDFDSNASLLTFTAKESGEVTLCASSLFEDEIGKYDITLLQIVDPSN